MVRGIEKRLIFVDDEDRLRFLERLGTVVRETRVRCLAFAIMPNHFHLVVETGPTPLSRVMHRLGTAHAMDFNRRHDRVGHLFQNRFKSKLVRDDAGVLAVVRYVHLNPVRAGLVKSLEALAVDPWTGHSALMGRLRAEFLDAWAVLSLFHPQERAARRELVSWMERGLAAADPDPFSREMATLPLRPPIELDLGPTDRDGARLAWRRRMAEAGWDSARVAAEICAGLGVDLALLGAGRRSRPASRAREAVAGVAVGLLGRPHDEAALAMGVTRQAVEQAFSRFSTRDDGTRRTVLGLLSTSGLAPPSPQGG